MASVFNRALTVLREAFKGETPQQREDAQQLKETKRYWGDDVALTLTDLVRNTETKASGQVQLVSLTEFRADIGPLWDTYLSRILMIAETTIARMIGKGNTFIPQKDDAWLLLFPGLPPPEARDRADEIAATIGEKLVGANFTPEEPSPPLAVVLETKGVVRADGSLDMEALHAAITRAREVKKTPPAKSSSATATAQAAPLALPLRPAWSAETETIDTFHLRAIGPDGQDFVNDPGAVMTTTVAQELCNTAEKLIAQITARRLRARLVLPLPFAALTSASANALHKALQLIPQQSRLMHLRMDIVRIPPRTSPAYLAALREAFRPMLREVGIALDPLAIDRKLFALEHVVFGVDLSTATHWNDSHIDQALRTLREKAGKQRLAVTGLTSPMQVAIAMAASVDEIAGAGLMNDLLQLPAALKPMRRTDFAM